MTVIDENNETITSIFSGMNNLLGELDFLISHYKPMLGGERYLTDHELSEKLHIHRRTLQDYRTNGMLPFIYLGGKILYKESDIEAILCNNYVRSHKTE